MIRNNAKLINPEQIRLLLEQLESCPARFDPEGGAAGVFVPLALFNQLKLFLAGFLRTS
jgi:hypothetical protein